jgi:hypothetical protein
MNWRLRNILEALLSDRPPQTRAPSVAPRSEGSGDLVPELRPSSQVPLRVPVTEPPMTPPDRPPTFEYRVIVLREGRQAERVIAGAMEVQLNELGAAGWQLVAVTGPRAILMRVAES